jgi:hypothetical protein
MDYSVPMRMDLTAAERLREIINLLDAAGIQPASDPKALPAVNLGEVRLVSWMAIESISAKGLAAPGEAT